MISDVTNKTRLQTIISPTNANSGYGLSRRQWHSDRIILLPRLSAGYQDSVLIIKPTRCTNFSKFIFGIELYMFGTVFLSIIRSLVLYAQQQIYVIQVFTDCLLAGSGWFYYMNISRCTFL